MNYEQAVAWVHGLVRLPQTPGLARMRALMEKLDNPQKKLCFIHVAGTNGKGSTVAMAASVLKQAGYRVGANISPYVLEFRERFQLNGEMISKNELAEILSKIKEAGESLPEPILEFEAVTAAAFVYFAQAGCDIVCLETGLGGRMDQTNIVENTLVACILHIGYDHTEFLGDSLAKITAEKCGIIKKGCTVVSYPEQPAEALQEIVACAKQMACPLVVPKQRNFHFYQGRPFENRIDYGGYTIQLPFVGRHQAYNAAVVIEAMLALCKAGYRLQDEHIIEGIQKAIFPARIEILSRKPLCIVDGAHNEDSVRALVETLKAERVSNLTAVVGALRDKQADTMLRLLAPFVSTLYTVSVPSSRSLTAAELAVMAKRYIGTVSSQRSLAVALQKAKQKVGQNTELTKNGGLLVCGSLYLAAEARYLMNGGN